MCVSVGTDCVRTRNELRGPARRPSYLAAGSSQYQSNLGHRTIESCRDLRQGPSFGDLAGTHYGVGGALRLKTNGQNPLEREKDLWRQRA